MKKPLAILLVILLVMSFVGCQSEENQSMGGTNKGRDEVSGTDAATSTDELSSADGTPSLIFGNTITAGYGYSAAVKTDGTMVHTGDSSFSARDQVISVDAYADHMAVLYSDHTVEIMTKSGYGTNSYDIPSIAKWTDIIAVSVGQFYTTIGLKADGTVVGAGISSPDDFETISTWTDIVAIDCAINVIGLKADGTVVCDNPRLDVSTWTDIVAVSIQSDYALGLKSDGTVVAVGTTQNDPCLEVDEWTDIVAICAGLNHAVGLKSDGTVVSTVIEDKDYDRGQTDVSQWTDIVAISANYIHTIGLKSDGTIVVAGDSENKKEEVESWTNIAMSDG